MGPARNEALVHAVHCPMAFDCAASRNVEMISASELGTRSAPAMPCTPRSTMRNSAVGEIAMSSDATPNAMSPTRSTTMRP